MMIANIIKTLMGTKNPAISRSLLIKKEAALGGQLFGKVPANRNREFFYMGNDTWVWNESWQNGSGQKFTQTVQYRILPTRIEKIQSGQSTPLYDMQEISNLVVATRWYYQLIAKNLYGRA